MNKRILFWAAVTFFGLNLAWASPAFCWSFQGHILITRLAALRIINDPAAPRGLREFLRANMKWTLADCEKLATTAIVGSTIQGTEYGAGLDNWCTMPDQIRTLPEGQVKIAPYDMSEPSMHFLDMEVFSKEMRYSDDLSTKPNIDQIPHDVNDPRWKLGGFLPFRVEEMYRKFTAALGTGAEVANPLSEEVLRPAGFLAHYVEDSTQPHHATVDYKSATYLVGHLAGLPTTQPATASSALAALRLPANVDPHGAIEYQLFENAQAPRDQFRREYWKELISAIDQQAAVRAKQPKLSPATFNPFRWDLETLSDSYDYLPFVGRAAQAGYSTMTFDAQAFFGYQGETHGQKMSMIQLIALQNAKAVLDVEDVFRLAWRSGHPAPL